MQEKARIFQSSSRFLIHFYTQKVVYYVFKDSSSPVKASSFNPLSPDLPTLYRRPNPIKIWPIYAVPPTTTLYPRSTYDLWRAGSSPTIFQPVEKLIPLTTTCQSGPDQSPLYFRPTYALPDQGPLIADPSIFPERGLIGSLVWTGLNNTTGHQALIGHQQLSDAVGLYGVFLQTRESCQFRWGKGHRSKSQNTKK